MSNYTKTTNFAVKDALVSGNPGKVVKGTEINTEFDNIQTAVNTKADIASPTFTGTTTIPTVDINGGAIDGTVIGGSSAAAGTFTALTTSGNATIGGNLTVTGNATISGNLTFGDADTDSVSFSADVASSITPDVDDTYDLGSASKEWRNLYVDGTANVDSLVADTADINGGTVDGAVIGGASAAAGTFTTATATTGNITTVNATTVDSTNVEVTNIKAKDGTASATIADTTGVMTVASSVLTTADINGGTADNVVIGGSTPAAGTFTSLNATGGGALTGTWSNLGSVTTVDINGGTIDGTTQATGTINGSLAVGGTWSAAATWTLPALTLGGTITSNGQSFSGTIANLGTVTTADINGGTGDSFVLGATTPAAATVTTFTSTGIDDNASATALTLSSAGVATFVSTSNGSAILGSQLSSDYTYGLRLRNDNTPTQYGYVAIEFWDRTTTVNAAVVGQRQNTAGNWNGMLSFRLNASDVPLTTPSSMTEYMRIDGHNDYVIFPVAGTKIGIGAVSTPDGTLHVHTASAGTVVGNASYDDLTVENSADAGITILTPDANFSGISFGSPTDNVGAFLAWKYNDSDFQIGTNKVGASFRLRADQSVTNLTLSGASGSELATFAGRVGVVGASPGSYAYYNDLAISADAEGGLTIRSTGTTIEAGIAFADGTTGDQQYRGRLLYNHSTDTLTLGASAGRQFTLTSSAATLASGVDLTLTEGKLSITDTANETALTVTSSATTATPFSVTAPTSNVAAYIVNSHATTPLGLNIHFSAASPDNNTQYFAYFNDSTTLRAVIYSDGDLANHDGVYGTISDIKLKTDIQDMRSYWDDFKALNYFKYKMKSDIAQYGDAAEYRLGLVAQQVETVFPSCVKATPDMEEVVTQREVITQDEDGNDVTTYEEVTETRQKIDADGKPEVTKIVKSSIIEGPIMAKVLQEAMKRIEALEAEIAALKAV